VFPGEKEGETERKREKEKKIKRERETDDITESKDTFHPYLLCLCIHNLAVEANAEAR